MKIRHVNHSGFVIEHNNKKIICDPWLDGAVFINGWRLVSPTLFEYKEFADIDYIWFSHEHPDHFFPPNLKKIASEHRKNITILFQDTIDKRVKDYCIHAGFKQVIELKKAQFHTIAPDFEIMCEHFEEGDSWICFKSASTTILNINDCGIANRRDIEKISTKIGGKVDILMTQFSYAYWAGNPEDIEERRQIALDKLHILKTQCDNFKPKVIIPIASFIYFSHIDNKYLNEDINTISTTYKFIKEYCLPEPVVLYNNETYTYPEAHDSVASLKKHEYDLKNVLDNEKSFDNTRPIIHVEELTLLADKLIDDLNKNNSFIIKMQLKPTNIYLTDYNTTYCLSLSGFKKSYVPSTSADIEVTSEILSWCLKYPFGTDTMQISGRLRKPKDGNYKNFYNFFRINHLKMRGDDPNSIKVIANIFLRKLQTTIGWNKNR